MIHCIYRRKFGFRDSLQSTGQLVTWERLLGSFMTDEKCPSKGKGVYMCNDTYNANWREYLDTNAVTIYQGGHSRNENCN